MWCSLGLLNYYVCTATAFPSSKLAFYTSTLLANSDTALWHWTQSVMKCASIKKACKERLQWTHSKFKHFHSIVPRKSLTFMRDIPSMFPVPAKERILPSCVQYAWNNLGYEKEWIQAVCISLIHRHGLEKPRFWQLFVHYFICLQAGIAALPKQSRCVPHMLCAQSGCVHTFCLHSSVLTMTFKNSLSFFILPNNQSWIAKPVS